MIEIKELNDEELKNVTGGVSTEDITHYSGCIEQIKNILSNIPLVDDFNITNARNYLDSSISYLKENNEAWAKESFLDAINELNQIQRSGNILPDNVLDIIIEARMIFGW